jgi:PhzF family phenazine biosynthesis protein
MRIPFFQVDAFSLEPFKGNVAGVCILPDEPLDALHRTSVVAHAGGGPVISESDLLQLIAMEKNIPETGFIRRREDGFSLRWFTTLTELNLCGHGTLAAAHVLYEEGWLQPSEVARFHTRSGLLSVRLLDEGWIEMDFPAFSLEPASLPESITSTFVRAPLGIYFAHDRYLVVLDSEAAVRDYQPDFVRLKDHRIIITAARDRAGATDAARDQPQEPYDFISRFFAGPLGVSEDPVTGSAHCALAPYWSGQLGKTSFLAYQASSRGGYLKVRLEGDRVLIAGQAITVCKGALGW